MKKIYLVLMMVGIGVECFGQQAPDWLWAHSAGGIKNDMGTSVTTDPSGNIIATGYFGSSSITFGTIILMNNDTNRNDIFVVKYDSLGNVLWAKSEGGHSHDNGNSVTTDANGNIIITGTFFSDSITFGTTTFTNSGYEGNIFVVKYDPSGNLLWAKSAGSSGDDKGWGVTTDATDNILVTGYFSGNTINFGSISLSNSGGSTTKDIFVAKYDASGNVLWAKSAGGYAQDIAGYIATDSYGAVIISGTYQSDSISFGIAAVYNTSNIGQTDLFIAKYDSAGSFLWAQSAVGTGSDNGGNISLDTNGNIFVTGSFLSDSITFGTITLTGNSANHNLYIVKYSPSGNPIWAKSDDGNGYCYGNSVIIKQSQQIVVAGSFFSDSITFGLFTLTKTGGTSDIFIVKYDYAGNVLWAKSEGGSDEDGSVGIAADMNGNIIIQGEFRSPTLTFGTNTLTNANPGGYDFFIAKLFYNDTLTSISDTHTLTSNFQISPNPATNSIQLTLAENVKELEIINVLGETVYEQKLQTLNRRTQITLDVSFLAKGTYFLKAGNEVRKFVKE